MTGMNRLSRWIVRTPGPLRPLIAAAPMTTSATLAIADAPAWLDDVRLFVTGWVGGLIFFGTLLG
jgi:hypothetical protein